MEYFQTLQDWLGKGAYKEEGRAKGRLFVVGKGSALQAQLLQVLEFL